MGFTTRRLLLLFIHQHIGTIEFQIKLLQSVTVQKKSRSQLSSFQAKVAYYARSQAGRNFSLPVN